MKKHTEARLEDAILPCATFCEMLRDAFLLTNLPQAVDCYSLL